MAKSKKKNSSKRVVKSPGSKVESKSLAGSERKSNRVAAQSKRSKMASVGASIKSGMASLNARRKDFLTRRPHRSFRRTRRRDYARSLKMPGYFMFTIEVAQMLWRHKSTYIWLVVVYSALTVAFGLLGSQEMYSQLSELIDNTAPEGLLSGVMGEVGRAGIVLTSALTGGMASGMTTAQQFTTSFLALYVWLTVVWLLRNQVAGKKVVLRDGLYSSGAPILGTFLTFVILLIQLIPAAVAIIVAFAGWQTGFIPEGAISFMVAMILAVLVILTLYWATSTFIALVVITLPGMRPFRALSIAGDLVVGRRLRLLYRLIWMSLVVISSWLVVAVPIILLDSWLSDMYSWIQSIPVVPILILVMSVLSVIWTSGYIYLLYRRVVDDDVDPA